MPKHPLLEKSNDETRTMFSARLSEETLDMLWALSERTEKSRAAIIERLVADAYRAILGGGTPKQRPRQDKKGGRAKRRK